METTEALYRFKTNVPAGKSGSLLVKEELVKDEHIEILPMDLGNMDFYSKTGEISKSASTDRKNGSGHWFRTSAFHELAARRARSPL